MGKAGLLEITGVGRIKIKPRGLDVLKGNPSRSIGNSLMQFPEFVEFQKVERKDVEQPGQPKLTGLVLDTSVTPTETSRC